MNEEQKAMLDKSGAKNDWVVGLICMLIFAAVIGISVFCRYSDNRKLTKHEHTQGVVTLRGNSREWIGRSSRIVDSISVEYTAEGSDEKYYYYDPEGPFEGFYEGQTVDVYYDRHNPDEAFIAKKDWLIRKDVRADVFYDSALIISAFPFFTGVYFFLEEWSVRRRIKKGTFNPK